jgi:hypothetical protein
LFVSVLYESYSIYERDRFVATVDDWKWFGSGAPPSWYSGNSWGG